MVKTLLIAASALLITAMLFGQLAKSFANAALYSVARGLCVIAALLASIVTLLGIAMIAMGG